MRTQKLNLKIALLFCAPARYNAGHLSKAKFMRCGKCGCESTLERPVVHNGRTLVWRRWRPGFDKRIWCTDCARREARQVTIATGLIFIFASALLVWCSLHKSRPRDYYGDPLAIIINLYLLLIFSYLCTIAHEIGHVIGAIIARLTVTGITLGQGRRLLSFSIAGVPVDFRIIPAGGFVTTLPGPSSNYRWRQVVTLVGGPLVNLLICVAAFACATIWGTGADQWMFKPAPWHMLVILNLCAFIANLAPGTFVRDGRVRRTDGMQLASLFDLSGFRKPQKIVFRETKLATGISSDQLTARSNRCSKCGCESALERMFKPHGIFQEPWCPGCIQRNSRLAGSFLLYLSLLIFGLMSWDAYRSRLNHTGTPPAWLINLQLFIVFECVCILPHELGHALGAWLTKQRVFRIVFGRGRQLAQWKIGGVLVELHAIPIAGFVQAQTLQMRGWRWRRAFFIACGPLANLLLVLIGFAAEPIRWSDARLFLPMSVWNVFALANLLLFVTSLIPRNALLDHGETGTDGRQLLSLFFKPLPSIKERRNTYYLARALALINRGDDARAVRLLGSICRRQSESSLYGVLAIAQIGAGRFIDAVRTIEPLLDQVGGPTPERAMLLNNFAWAHLMIRSQESIEKADRASAEAYSLLPWQAAVQGTRGLALAELGAADDAIPLLRRSLRGAFTAENRASVICSIALAQAKRGNRKKAGRFLKRAARIDPKCRLLPRVREALQSPTHQMRTGLLAPDTVSLANSPSL